MIFVFEVALENWKPIFKLRSPPPPVPLCSRSSSFLHFPSRSLVATKRNLFKQPVRLTLSTSSVRLEAAVSGLEFTGNNIVARRQPRSECTCHDKVSQRSDAFAQLLNCQSQFEVCRVRCDFSLSSFLLRSLRQSPSYPDSFGDFPFPFQRPLSFNSLYRFSILYNPGFYPSPVFIHDGIGCTSVYFRVSLFLLRVDWFLSMDPLNSYTKKFSIRQEFRMTKKR